MYIMFWFICFPAHHSLWSTATNDTNKQSTSCSVCEACIPKWNKSALIAATASEQCHHSTCLLHPCCCCGKRCGQKWGGCQYLKEWRLELLSPAELEQNTFSFCLQSHSSHPVTQIPFCFCRGCWIRFCRGTTAESPAAAWQGEPRPCQPHNWPFCGSWFSCRCLSTPFHVNLNICSSER